MPVHPHPCQPPYLSSSTASEALAAMHLSPAAASSSSAAGVGQSLVWFGKVDVAASGSEPSFSEFYRASVEGHAVEHRCGAGQGHSCQ